MIQSVETEEGLSCVLSTGTKLSVWPAKNAEGMTAWVARLVDPMGEEMHFGISHEAFQNYVGLVSQLYVRNSGFKDY